MINTDTEEGLRQAAQDAITWAHGSWGQSRMERDKYPPEIMAQLWLHVALLAVERSNAALIRAKKNEAKL